jgi:hypothetical protein
MGTWLSISHETAIDGLDEDQPLSGDWRAHHFAVHFLTPELAAIRRGKGDQLAAGRAYEYLAATGAYPAADETGIRAVQYVEGTEEPSVLGRQLYPPTPFASEAIKRFEAAVTVGREHLIGDDGRSDSQVLLAEPLAHAGLPPPFDSDFRLVLRELGRLKGLLVFFLVAVDPGQPREPAAPGKKKQTGARQSEIPLHPASAVSATLSLSSGRPASSAASASAAL